MFIIWQFVNDVFGIFMFEKEHVDMTQLLNSGENVSWLTFEKFSPIILQSLNFVFCSFVLSIFMFDRLQF